MPPVTEVVSTRPQSSGRWGRITAYIETAKPIVEKITKYPDAIHLWDDVFRSNIMHPEVLSAFQRIQNGVIDFNGTFLLVADDQEFTEDDFPPFPGVHIDFEDITVLLSYLERQMRRKQGRNH